jgi:predicted DNA-binding transcriptional regulator AlpA
LERIAYTIPEFCFRNSISRPTYHRLRSQGLGPTEMRIGLNLVRISAAAELEWQQRLQKPQRDVEAKALERAVKAGSAAVKSSKHISKARRGRRRPPPPSGTGVRDE